MDRDQDSADVRRVLEGELQAFENIVRRWQSPLINLAYRYCRDRQRAEEMAQDAFMQIYRNLHKFRGDAAFSTWLFAVSLNLYRSFMRRKSIPVESIDALTEIAGGQLPQLQVEQEERDDLVRRAVAALAFAVQGRRDRVLFQGNGFGGNRCYSRRFRGNRQSPAAPGPGTAPQEACRSLRRFRCCQ